LAQRATRASRRLFPGAYLPFHLAGQPFHRFNFNILNDFYAHHRCGLKRRFVSALLPGFSPFILADAASLLGGRSFLNACASKAVRQLTNPINIVDVVSNKIFGAI